MDMKLSLKTFQRKMSHAFVHSDSTTNIVHTHRYYLGQNILYQDVKSLCQKMLHNLWESVSTWCIYISQLRNVHFNLPPKYYNTLNWYRESNKFGIASFICICIIGDR